MRRRPTRGIAKLKEHDRALDRLPPALQKAGPSRNQSLLVGPPSMAWLGKAVIAAGLTGLWISIFLGTGQHIDIAGFDSLAFP